MQRNSEKRRTVIFALIFQRFELIKIRTATAQDLLVKRKRCSGNPLGKRNSIPFLKRKERNSKPKRTVNPKKQKNQSLQLNQ